MPPPLFPAGKPIRNESLTTCNGAGAVVHDPIQPDKQNNQIRSPGTRAVEVAGPHRIASRNLGNPPGQRQRKEEDPVSGPTPAQRFPQEPRVSSNLPRGKANLPPAGGTEVRAPRGPTRRSVFSLGPGAARSLFVKNNWGPRASPAKRVAWGKAEQRERAQFSPQAETERADFVTPLMGGGLPD